MGAPCGVCHAAESKYKCPVCELRYCSIACYKPHKATHENKNENETRPDATKPSTKRNRPESTQRAPKVDFTGFENDKDFQYLLRRYPLLKIQLQAVYGLTLEPGPDEERSWSRQPLPGDLPPQSSSRGRGRGRGARGGRGGRGGRGMDVPSDRQHGPWTREKGDKEALAALKKMRGSEGDGDQAEGLREFVGLCRMKFGDAKGKSETMD